MKRFWIRKGLMFTAFFIVAVILFSAIVMSLWNAILPVVLGVKAITFLQALGLLVLSKILFGGFGHRRWGGGRYQWKRNMQDKWATMSEEEREKFKAERWNRCGGRWGNPNQTAGTTQ